MTTKGNRAALYARFSSDLQKDRSVDDQFALARRHAAGKGYKIVAEYSDRAKSGSTLFDRTGAIDLVRDAIARKFDFVVVESLDRLSRDQEDLAGMFKRFKHHGIAIDTLNEGIATKLHVGIRGFLGQIQNEDHGNRIRDRLSVLAREGKTCGWRCYGYRPSTTNAGELEIDPDKAKIVRRIFREYVAGTSPVTIARGLNRDRIPSPNGGEWINQSFIGSKKSRGILRNETYVGIRIWNRTSRSKDPDTGKEQKTVRPENEWIKTDEPHLRIVDDQLWRAAQAAVASRAVKRFGPDGTIRRSFIAHSPHLLARVLRCGKCGSPMRVTNGAVVYSARAGCSAAAKPSAAATCDHKRSYSMDRLQALVGNAIREVCADPAAIAHAVKVYHDRYAERDRGRRAEYDAARKRLTAIEAATQRLVDALDALDTGSMPTKVIVERLQKLEAERVGLAERVRLGAGDPANVTVLHPKARASFLAAVETLTDGLKVDEITTRVRTAFLNLIDVVEVHPVPNRQPYRINLYARPAAMLGGLDLFPKEQPIEEIVADRGGPTGIVQHSGPGWPGTESSHKGKPLNLGRFEERRAA